MRRAALIGILVSLSALYLYKYEPQIEERAPSSSTVVSKETAFALTPTLQAGSETLNLFFSKVASFAPKFPKVFETDEEKRNKRSELSDRGYIEAAGNILKSVFHTFDPRAENDRLRALNYLAAAMAAKDNPERDTVLRTIEDSLTNDNVSPTEDMREKRSIAGDKIELFQILLTEAPEVAKKIESEGSPWLARILKYARGEFEAMAALSKN